MPVTSTAAPIPDADRIDAVVATITADGQIFIGAEPIPREQLPERIRSEIAASQDKVLYVMADARSPYRAVVAIFDAARAAGVTGMSMLTAQDKATSPATPRPPQGFELSMRR
jgi:biopolymer transport protein ExbD